MVSGKKPTLQKTTAADDGIMDQLIANHDNTDADARQSNDTPKRMQRNANAEDEITKTMETSKPIHSRTRSRETEGDKGPTK